MRTAASWFVLAAFALAADAAACTATSAAHPRWTLASDGGVAWLVTPCGERFYSVGINGLDGGSPVRRRTAYHWARFFPDFASWLTTTRARAAGWGFNTASAGSLPPHVLRMPEIPNLKATLPQGVSREAGAGVAG